MKNAALLGVLLSSSESSDLEEQMWALRALLHLSLDGTRVRGPHPCYNVG